MSVPGRSPSRSRVPRAEWLSARAALAGRRSGRFAFGAAATFVVVLLALLVVPQFGRRLPDVAATPAAHPDTLPFVRALVATQAARARADSQYARAVAAATRLIASPEGLTADEEMRRDSLQSLASELDILLDRTTKAPLPSSYRALAAAHALGADARMRPLDDSLAALERQRGDLGPAGGSERAFADLTAAINDVGLVIRDAASRRRAALGQEIVALDASTRRAADVDTTAPRAARDVARTEAAAADSALSAVRAQGADADRREAAARDRANHAVPPVAMLGAATILAVIVGFSMSLASEIGRPTIAGVREAERAGDAPVLAVVGEEAHAQPAGAVDPFRMLFLGLTATGARVRSVTICGDDRGVAATVAGRLALAAATDERATLVVDADAEGSPVAGFYLERPEPGFTDAVAGVRLWREVARPVGTNAGLAIDVVPGGSIRREPLDEAMRATAREEFARFRAEYDLCILVAPTDVSSARLAGVIDAPLVVLCAELGRTTLSAFRADALRLRSLGADLHGIILWDAQLPHLAHRNELLARELSMDKRAGLTARP